MGWLTFSCKFVGFLWHYLNKHYQQKKSIVISYSISLRTSIQSDLCKYITYFKFNGDILVIVYIYISINDNNS